MEKFILFLVISFAVLNLPAFAGAGDDEIFAKVEKAVEGMGFAVQEKRFFKDMPSCQKNLDAQIATARAANPNVEIIDLKPYMKIDGHYSFAVATSETDFYGHYCLPAAGGRAGYFKAKKIL